MPVLWMIEQEGTDLLLAAAAPGVHGAPSQPLTDKT